MSRQLLPLPVPSSPRKAVVAVELPRRRDVRRVVGRRVGVGDLVEHERHGVGLVRGRSRWLESALLVDFRGDGSTERTIHRDRLVLVERKGGR